MGKSYWIWIAMILELLVLVRANVKGCYYL